MENFILHIAQNPLLYVGYLFSLFAAAGVLYFVAGFMGGMKHQITYSEDADHVVHDRTHALQGLYLCMVVLGLWQAVRVFMGEASPSILILSFVLLSPLWAPWLKATLSGKGGGGH